MPEITGSADAMLVLELATENAQLRVRLAELQDQCVELAVDAGELHAEIEALRRELSEIKAESGCWNTAPDLHV